MSKTHLKNREVLLTSLRSLKLYVADKAAEIIEAQTLDIRGLTQQLRTRTAELEVEAQRYRSLSREMDKIKRELAKTKTELNSLGLADINR